MLPAGINVARTIYLEDLPTHDGYDEWCKTNFTFNLAAQEQWSGEEPDSDNPVLDMNIRQRLRVQSIRLRRPPLPLFPQRGELATVAAGAIVTR